MRFMVDSEAMRVLLAVVATVTLLLALGFFVLALGFFVLSVT
jgi:hypothetical protein